MLLFSGVARLAAGLALSVAARAGGIDILVREAFALLTTVFNNNYSIWIKEEYLVE